MYDTGADFLIQSSLVLPDDVSARLGTGYTLNYDTPRLDGRFFFSLPLRFLHPSVCLHLSCLFVAAGLASSLSELLAVLTVSCGLQGCWDGLHAKLGARSQELRPRLTQVTLGLEALTAFTSGGRQKDGDIHHIFISPLGASLFASH